MKTKMLVIVLFMVFISCGKTEDEGFQDVETPDLPDNNDNNSTNGETTIIQDEFNGRKTVLAGNSGDNFIVSFERKLDGTELTFQASADDLPTIMEDNEGNKWDIFGVATDGPRKGKRLKATNSMMGYWFSFGTFYPGIELYPDNGKGDFDGESISGSGDWLVPANEVRDGGPGKDGIPAIGNPKFESTSVSSYLNNTDLVVGVKFGDQVKAYPHPILDWHEIVNDEIGENHYSVIYCPLTGTATIWDRVINNKESSFGVSGLLYNSNIIPYDRSTDSNWSQIYDRSINGNMKGVRPRSSQAVETTFATWKKMFPNSQMMNQNTGFSRNYDRYPYGSYKTGSQLIFPVEFNDNRLHPKERVHIIIVNDKARAYRFESF